MPHNLEPSRFNHGSYVGYEASTGVTWSISKGGRGYNARRNGGGGFFSRRTLKEVSKQLEKE